MLFVLWKVGGNSNGNTDYHLFGNATGREHRHVSFFLYKLIAPRTTFAHDMSRAERKLMDDHGVYWKDLADKRIAVLFGPVLDPKGGWGLAVVETQDEAAVRAIGINDPAIKANQGFRFEIYPMLSATLRK